MWQNSDFRYIGIAFRGFVGSLVFVFLAGLAVGESQARELTVTGVRVGVNPTGTKAGTTRVVLDLSAPVPYSAFLLGNPYRLVIDLPEVSWGVNGDAANSARGVVTNLRYGLFQAGNSRVVVDLKSPVRIVRHSVLSGPNRVMFDLYPVTRTAFAPGKAVTTPDWRPPRKSRPATPVPKTAKDSRRVIILDAGHGGVDPGAIRRRVYEKHLTLPMAKSVGKALEATGRYRVIMTRRRDVFLELRKRVEIASANKGEFFISFHADTIGRATTRGASIYTLSETSSDKEAAELAAKENRVDAIGGIDLNGYSDGVAGFLFALRFRHNMNESGIFAGYLTAHFKKQSVRMVRGISHRSAGFAVLKAPDVPSVLIELGYLSNSADRKMLATREFRRHVSRAVVGALDQYFRRKAQLTKAK